MIRDILSGILITCLLAAAGAFLPVVGTLCAVFIPAPIMGYRLKSGRRAAAAIAAGVLLIVGTAGGGADLLFFGLLVFTGLLMGETTAAGLALERAVLVTAGASAAAGWAGLKVLAASAGIGAWELIHAAVRASLELTLAVYREIGIDEEQVRFLADSQAALERVLAGITPGLGVAALLLVIWVCLLCAPAILRRLGAAAPDYGALNRWRAPEPLVWAAIGAGVLLLVPEFTAKIAGLNVLVALMAIYFFQGIAIVAYYLERQRVPRAARGIVYALVFVQQLVLLAVIAAGFFDTWFNFRRIETPLAPSEAE
jgi:uncharacterized protein YybS (DUF2232 family)